MPLKFTATFTPAIDMPFKSCELNILVLNESEVGGDLVWGGNLTLKLANYALMHLNGTEISITT